MKNEIACLKKLNDLTGQIDDILLFLKNEDLVNDVDIKTIRQSSDRPKEIATKLENLKNNKKIQLLEYNWQILPKEFIIINIITDSNRKEFSYNT